jgi:apolipoprotein N-acyltransferase
MSVGSRSRHLSTIAYTLSVLGGALYFLGWAGFGIWPLELVAFVPLWCALELLQGRPWKHAAGVGLMYGTVAMGGGYHWMFETSREFSGFGAIANVGVFIACAAYLGSQFGIQALLYRAVRGRGGSVTSAALCSLLVTEWLFPRWYPAFVGNSLVDQTLFVQVADLGGPLLLSALVGIVNVVLFELLRWTQGSRGFPALVLTAATSALMGSALYGSLRIGKIDAAVETAPAIEIGLVQAYMSIPAKAEDPLESPRRHLEQSRELEARGALDLLVWPETSYYPYLPRSVPFEAADVRAGLRSPILFGAFSFRMESGRMRVYNSAFLLESDDWIRSMYDKNHLMLGGEHIPFGERFPFLYRLVPNAGRLTPGRQLEPLQLGAWRISTPICYEDILPGFIRDMVNHAEPHILINLTNDVWFRDSQATWIHLRLAQLRAVEHRRYLVRATNTGVTAVVDPAGRVVAKAPVLQRDSLRVTVHMLEGQTLYARLGDWPGWLSLLGMGALVARRGRR